MSVRVEQIVMPDILRLCTNCKHKRLDDGDDESWEYCDRPNYPEGKNWNKLTIVQRYSGDLNKGYLCNGKHWVPKEAAR